MTISQFLGNISIMEVYRGTVDTASCTALQGKKKPVSAFCLWLWYDVCRQKESNSKKCRLIFMCEQ